ncbi:fatty acyl-CoA reductase 1-like [Vicia villosa]|uniref:fatty acyl-CoA reductase 1-like n=1 Tax=Vicia villosa TaxID=3911 RepID=UPI00273AAF37|nr:fatty acyl-CoA reductase 1-like [Vicia villosa]
MDPESSSNIQDFFKGKTILVTGPTGFLAKVFIEKILRIQPEIKKLYLLLRASNSDLAANRLQNEIFEIDLFQVLRGELGEDFDSFVSKKVVAIAGDVGIENLGIKSEKLKNEMFEEIDVIVHSAATTNFDERFDISMGVNTKGALHALNFAKYCQNLKAFVHISTAYVCGDAKHEDGIVREKAFQMDKSLKETSKLCIHNEMNLLEKKRAELKAMNADENTVKFALKYYGMERANLHGWPNTYVFTKAMGEMLIVHHKDNVPLIIIRPTMVTSTFNDPFPGWIEGVRTIDSVIYSYGQGKLKSFVGDPITILDVIPADMVINCVIASIFIHSNQPPKNFIYQVSSSIRNPLTYCETRNFCHRYFTKNPCINQNGKPIVVSNPFRVNSFAAFNIYMIVIQKVLNLVSKICPNSFQDIYDKKSRQIRMMHRLGTLYKPYVYFKSVFDDTNTEILRMATKGDPKMENVELNFDPTSIDWTDYMMNTHIPGLVKYQMK